MAGTFRGEPGNLGVTGLEGEDNSAGNGGSAADIATGK